MITKRGRRNMKNKKKKKNTLSYIAKVNEIKRLLLVYQFRRPEEFGFAILAYRWIGPLQLRVINLKFAARYSAPFNDNFRQEGSPVGRNPF
jgi:hypothetical protein